MKLKLYITASFLLSLMAHIILMLSLAEVRISSPLPVAHTKIKKPIHITIWPKIKLIQPKLQQKKNNSDLDGHTRQISEKRIQDIFKAEHLAQKGPDALARFSGIEKAKITPRLPTPPNAKQATAPRPKIVEIDTAKLDAARIGKRVVVPKANRENVTALQLPSLLPEGPLTEGVAPTYDVGIRMSAPNFSQPDLLPDDAPIGGSIPAAEHLGLIDTADALKDRNKLKTVPFDQFVNTNIVVKDAPNGGYFMLQISANEKSESVKEINKDVMLIIDKSYSIPRKKFAAFKNAAISALDYLNPQDRFNIVTFDSQAIAFSNKYKEANQENRKKGQDFISKLIKGGMTNLFDGLYPFVKNTSSQDGRPLNIFLLTDGVSTVNIYKDDDFIRNVTTINPGHVSIFPFCAGDETNQDLLDFLGFLNRGNCFHAAKIPDINDNLTRFIIEHCSLLIRDLEYIAEGSVADTIYPRKLQHLYRGGNVTLYGKYQPDDKELVITLLGIDHAGTKRDIILKFNLKNCKRTELPIDKQWAATKILHLVADRTLTTSPEEKSKYTSEIKRLALQFNLAVPY